MSMNMMTELIPNIRYLMDRQTPIICIMYDDEWSDEVILLLLNICSSSQCQQSIITMQTGDIKMKCQQSAGHGWCLLCWHCSTIIIMPPIILVKTGVEERSDKCNTRQFCSAELSDTTSYHHTMIQEVLKTELWHACRESDRTFFIKFIDNQWRSKLRTEMLFHSKEIFQSSWIVLYGNEKFLT